ncbi:MAG: hypothetical protein ABI120_22430 [Gemmatimonadaceae bacterium]
MDSANLSAGEDYPTVLGLRNLNDSANAVSNRAVRLNPLSRRMLSALANDRAAPLDTVRRRCDVLKRVYPAGGVGCETSILLRQGKRAEAIALSRQFADTSGRCAVRLGFARLLLNLGDTVSARQEMAKVADAYSREYIREDRIATTYYDIGDTERSIEWWAKAGNSNSSQIVLLANGEQFAKLRKDPRVQAILKKAGAIK